MHRSLRLPRRTSGSVPLSALVRAFVVAVFCGFYLSASLVGKRAPLEGGTRFSNSPASCCNHAGMASKIGKDNVSKHSDREGDHQHCPLGNHCHHDSCGSAAGFACLLPENVSVLIPVRHLADTWIRLVLPPEGPFFDLEKPPLI